MQRAKTAGTESSPEQLFNTHFDLENLQEEEISELLEDEEEVISAANEMSSKSESTNMYSEKNLEPEPEKRKENLPEEDPWII